METWSCFLDREHTAFRRRAIPRVAGAGGGRPLAQRPLLWARPSGGIRIGTVRSGLPVPPGRTGGCVDGTLAVAVAQSPLLQGRDVLGKHATCYGERDFSQSPPARLRRDCAGRRRTWHRPV